jgi:flavin-dependent dehydrogenase
VRLGTQVKALKVAEGEGGVRVVLGGEEIQVDTVILATPAGVTAKLLAGMLDEGRDGCPQRLIHELERLDKARQALIRVREAVRPHLSIRDAFIPRVASCKARSCT